MKRIEKPILPMFQVFNYFASEMGWKTKSSSQTKKSVCKRLWGVDTNSKIFINDGWLKNGLANLFILKVVTKEKLNCCRRNSSNLNCFCMNNLSIIINSLLVIIKIIIYIQ